MNKIILCMMICLAVQNAVMAQRGGQELCVSYGTLSGTQLFMGISGRNDPGAAISPFRLLTSNTGNIFVTYRYVLSRKWEAGVAAGYQSFSYMYYEESDPVLNYSEYEGSFRANIFTLAMETKFVYYAGKIFQLYCFAGIGARYNRNTVTAYGPAYTLHYDGADYDPPFFFNTQWTPIGIRIGNKWSGFAELGFGFKGLANCGLSYRFNAHKEPVHHNGL